MNAITSRRIIFASLAFAIGLSAVSCSGKNAADTKEPVTTEVSVTDVQPEISDVQTEAAETESDDEDLIFDFTGLDSQKYIEIFADTHYTLNASIRQNQIELSQVMYVDAENERVLFNYTNPAYTSSVYITSEKLYNICQDKYFCMDISEYHGELMDSYVIYKNCGYKGSGTKELGGVSYKYDEYYDLDQERSFMILMDSSSNLEGILDAGMFTRISGLSREFDDSAFDILDGLTEISQEEYGQLMAELNSFPEDNTENHEIPD